MSCPSSPPNASPSPTSISSPRTHSIPLADRITSISPPDSPTLTEPAGDLPILLSRGLPRLQLRRPQGPNPSWPTYLEAYTSMGVTKDPHYIAFHINTFTHRHITVGRREGATEPLGDYAEDLVAAPFWDPMPNTVDDTDLLLFAPSHPDAQAIDIANGGLRDPGVVADIDRYRVLWSEKEELQRRERELADAWDQWRDTSGGVTKRLTMAKARSRLHPYLMGQAHVATVRNNNDLAISSGIPISDVIHHRVPTPPYALPYPQLHDEERPSVTRWIRTMGQQSHVSEQPMPTPQHPASRIKCTKCTARYKDTSHTTSALREPEPGPSNSVNNLARTGSFLPTPLDPADFDVSHAEGSVSGHDTTGVSVVGHGVAGSSGANAGDDEPIHPDLHPIGEHSEEHAPATIHMPDLQATQEFIDLLRSSVLEDTGMLAEDIDSLRNPEPGYEFVDSSPLLRSL
ncbi:hypothetical protein EDB85DRAFT_2152999 [Lactarius pseudohatsudake]|nr:hypothetical protein EDB85DRAFT_2152999 [Lactarius pseudohatsudake]